MIVMTVRLTTEEQEIVGAFERGELRSPRNKAAMMKKHREYAAATLREDRTPPVATRRPLRAGSGRAG
jgi:hypothetical protein